MDERLERIEVLRKRAFALYADQSKLAEKLLAEAKEKYEKELALFKDSKGSALDLSELKQIITHSNAFGNQEVKNQLVNIFGVAARAITGKDVIFDEPVEPKLEDFESKAKKFPVGSVVMVRRKGGHYYRCVACQRVEHGAQEQPMLILPRSGGSMIHAYLSTTMQSVDIGASLPNEARVQDIPSKETIEDFFDSLILQVKLHDRKNKRMMED